MKIFYLVYQIFHLELQLQYVYMDIALLKTDSQFHYYYNVIHDGKVE